MVVTSFFTPATDASLRVIVRRGLQTVLNLQEPPIMLTLRRVENDGTVTDFPALHVAMRYTGGEPGDRATEGADDDFLRGTVRSWAPWDVQNGDTFTLSPSGLRGRIVAVPPSRYGIQAAQYEVSA